MSFANILVNAAYNNTLRLTPQEILFIQKSIQKSPQVFENLNLSIQEINKISMIEPDYIPQLIMYIYKLYKHNYTVDPNIDLINITQFTVDIFLEIVPISPFDDNRIQNVVDYSFQLLKTNVPFTEKEETTVCYSIIDFFKDLISSIGHWFSCTFTSEK